MKRTMGDCQLDISTEEAKENVSRKSKKKFDWGKWDFDCDGEAYIIAKDECPNREDVPEWIVSKDNLALDVLDGNKSSHMSIDDVKQGWCKYQVRTDWENGDGNPQGGYYVLEGNRPSESLYPANHEKHGKLKPSWFPVWIVRLGDWY